MALSIGSDIPNVSNYHTRLVQFLFLWIRLKNKFNFGAGHYVPQLADLVYERNKDRNANTYINFKGFIVRIYISFDSLICVYCLFCPVRCYFEYGIITYLFDRRKKLLLFNVMLCEAFEYSREKKLSFICINVLSFRRILQYHNIQIAPNVGWQSNN